MLAAVCALLLGLAWYTPAAAVPSAVAPPEGVTAQDWLIADAGSGAVLAASGLHGRDLPASTMKILTALTILPDLPPDRVITFSDSASRVDGTRVGLVPGVSYTVRDLATAMLISSGNDATMALVEASGGSQAVLGRMNALAARLGARDTVAGDPTGLDSPGQLTSVHDLAVFGRAALADPVVRPYLTIPHASLPGRDGQRFEIQNHNLLLGRYEGAVGVKNGYTVAAGATFVGAATRNGRTLVVALLRTAPAFDRDARALLDWGFTNGAQVTPIGYLPDAAGQGPVEAAGPAVDGQLPPAQAGGIPTARAGDGQASPSGPIGAATWLAISLTASAALATMAMRAVTRRRRGRLRAATRVRVMAAETGSLTVPVSRRDGEAVMPRRPSRAAGRSPADRRQRRRPHPLPRYEQPTGPIPIRRRPPRPQPAEDFVDEVGYSDEHDGYGRYEEYDGYEGHPGDDPDADPSVTYFHRADQRRPGGHRHDGYWPGEHTANERRPADRRDERWLGDGGASVTRLDGRVRSGQPLRSSREEHFRNTSRR